MLWICVSKVNKFGTKNVLMIDFAICADTDVAVVVIM